MKFLYVLTAYCFSAGIAYSQTSLIQDDKGETSLIISEASSRRIGINVADASISLGLLDKNSSKNSFWGGTAKFKTSDNIASLLSGTAFNPSVDLNLSFGHYFTKGEKVRIWYVSPAINVDQFKVLETSSFSDKSFVGGSIKAGINKIGEAFGSSAIIGYSISGGYFNNTSDLKTADIYTQIVSGSTVVLTGRKSGYVNNYHEFFGVRLNIDYAVFPFENFGYISLAVYGRGQIWGYQPTQKAGIGVFIAQKGAPTKIVAGISYQVNDIFNAAGDEPTFLKRTGVNLVAGFNF